VAVPALAALIAEVAPPLAFSLASGVPLFPLRYVAFLIPANFIWFAVDNAIYLRAPSPVQRGLSADPSAMGREFFSIAAKGSIMVLAGGVAAGLGYLVWTLTDSMIAGLAATWLFLAACAIAMVLMAGVAFRDLDLVQDRV